MLFFSSAPYGQTIGGDASGIGRFIAKCTLPANLLNTGTYYIDVAFSVMDPGVVSLFHEQDALSFQVTEDLSRTLDTFRNGYSGVIPGVVRPVLEWAITKMDQPATQLSDEHG